MSLDLVRETFGNPPVYVAESEASWLYTPVDNLSGLPRHDDMADGRKTCRTHLCLSWGIPAERNFVLKFYRPQGTLLAVFPGLSWCSSSLDGDALFRETIGRTDLPTGSTEQLLHSIQTQLFTLPNYDVYPGHGPATTIAHEKTFNPFFLAKKPRIISLVLSYQIITRSSGERHIPSPSLTS